MVMRAAQSKKRIITKTVLILLGTITLFLFLTQVTTSLVARKNESSTLLIESTDILSKKDNTNIDEQRRIQDLSPPRGTF